MNSAVEAKERKKGYVVEEELMQLGKIQKGNRKIFLFTSS
jgi:hypothetical protein